MKKANQSVRRFIHCTSQMCSYMFIILLVFGALSCKKDDPPQPEAVADLNKEGLAYINLPVGKYFIYKDSATGIEDSVIVTTSSLEYIHEPASPGTNTSLGRSPFKYQVFTLILTKIKPLPRGEWFYGKTQTDIYLPVITVSAFISMRQRDNSTVFFYPTQGYSDITLIPTLTIEGKTYSDVIQVTEEIGGYPIDDPLYKKIIYYWVKNVGIIKAVTVLGSVSSVYTLLRSS